MSQPKAGTASAGSGASLNTSGSGIGPRDWTMASTNISNMSTNDIKAKSWTQHSITGTISMNSADKYGSYAPDPITRAPDQWGKSASLRPIALTEKNWGKHRTERSNLEKRDKLIQEVIETERSYVNSLQIMARKYASPLKADPSRYGVKPEQVAIVFESIEPIVAFHMIFLVELEKDRNPARTIIQFGDFLKMYTTFISSYDRCVRIIGQMRKSSRFTKFLDETRHDPDCHGLDLMSYMIMPIQRIPRYELLLRELISCSETDADLNQAYDRIRYIAKHVNETQRHVENMMKLLEIQDRITNSELSFELLQPHRRLLKEGRIQQRTDSRLNKWKQRVLFLFSDILLWTSSSNSYIGHVDLSAVTIKDHTKYTDVAFRVSIDHLKTELIWRCETKDECDSWRQAIDQAMAKLCEVLVSRLDEKDRERFEHQLSGGDGSPVDKAEVLRQAKLSVRRKKYERQNGGALHQFMKEKLQELQQNTNLGCDEDSKSNLSSSEIHMTDNEQ